MALANAHSALLLSLFSSIVYHKPLSPTPIKKIAPQQAPGLNLKAKRTQTVSVELIRAQWKKKPIALTVKPKAD